MSANIMNNPTTMQAIDESREFSAVRMNRIGFINYRDYQDIPIMQDRSIHYEWAFYVFMIVLMIIATGLTIAISRWFLIMIIIVFIYTIICLLRNYIPKPVMPVRISFSYSSSSGRPEVVV